MPFTIHDSSASADQPGAGYSPFTFHDSDLVISPIAGQKAVDGHNKSLIDSRSANILPRHAIDLKAFCAVLCQPWLNLDFGTRVAS
jgi:hypothetical protein